MNVRRLKTTLLLATALLLPPLVACNGQAGGQGEHEGGEGEEEKKFRPDPRTLVEVSNVKQGTVADFLVSTGTVESEYQADIVPETSGQVTKILVEEGDQVSAGQVLAVVRNINLSAAFDRAEAELARAETELMKVEQLHKQGAVSDRDLSDAQHAVRTARASRAEAAGGAGQTRITSPIAGTLAVRDIRYGEVAGGKRAFQVVDLEKLRVVVRLPERDLARLTVGLPAKLTSVYDEENPVHGEVTRISPTVDPQTGTVRVTIELEQGQTALRPGQYVSARVEVDTHPDVVVIPRRALLYEEGNPIAFRVSEEDPPPRDEKEEEASPMGGFSFGGGMMGGDDKIEDADLPGPYRIARKVELEIGYVDDDNVEIISGLSVTEDVVTTGHAALRDGARVRYPEDPRYGDIDPDADPDADPEDAPEGTEEKAAEGEPDEASAG